MVILLINSNWYVISESFNDCLLEIKKIKAKYPDFYGVFNWEYFDSPPNPNKNPNLWCETKTMRMLNKQN